MERIILSLAFMLLISTETNATPIIDHFYEVVPIEKAHYLFGSAQRRELNPESIKAFVWNIKKTQEDGWKQEFESYGQNKDLFLIQEAYESQVFYTTTREFTDVRWDMGVSFLYKIYDDAATGTVIGSKVDPTEIIVKHSVDDEPVVGTPKAMTIGKYPIAGENQELLVISVHGINITSFDSFKRHMKQAETEILKHKGPVLFAGDFNTRTKERTKYLFNLAKKIGLDMVNFKNAQYRMVWKFTKNYLDHGFVRGLTVKSAEVLKDSHGSDHKPLTLELAVTH